MRKFGVFVAVTAVIVGSALPALAVSSDCEDCHAKITPLMVKDFNRGVMSKTMTCADCHGDNGLGDEDTPAIAGLDEASHVKELKAFKSGERVDEDEMMIDYVEDLSDQDMADLAAYFSSLATEFPIPFLYSIDPCINKSIIIIKPENMSIINTHHA